MKQLILILSALWMLQSISAQQKAVVTETLQEMKTYPFSDPDPVADPSDLFYPYFRFDGFAAKSENKKWKVVELENDYIALKLFPEIGGKVWGAVDKTTQKEFIYNNHVVKFRDIAMRGPWTSGGIEFNFGIIGHAPTSSTPVDYLIRNKNDGSVSCYVSSYDLITRTLWTVEVNLPKDKAYFTTKTTWYNASSIDQPYYQWMNAGYKAAGNIEFCYPGSNYIGHDGELNSFPLDEQGRDISWYKNNNFGGSKSFHVLGYYNDFYGAYWHDDDFGSVHHADYDEKLGMKIFLWSLARDGGIWEELLTDADGQYVELQSGRVYNQPASNSAYTPYKHNAFAPQATHVWTEYWFPVKGIKGISKASRIGALHASRENGALQIRFSPLQQLATELKIYDKDRLVRTVPLETGVLQPWEFSIPQAEAPAVGNLKVIIGDHLLVYSEVKEDFELARPQQLPEEFDWNSAYGLYTQGRQWMNQKVYDKAEQFLIRSLEKEPYFIPALNSIASLYYRQGRYADALAACKKALSIDTYQGEANYTYGMVNRALGHVADAKDGFSVATYSSSVQSPAYEQLAELYLKEKDWNKAEHYASRSLEYNQMNLDASRVLMVVYRLTNQPEKAEKIISPLLEELPLFHAARFEQYLLKAAGTKMDDFTALIRNELPFETYLELAGWYESIGRPDEALTLLTFADNYPIANYKKAYLLHAKGDDTAALEVLEKANKQSPVNVFPFRPETLDALNWAATVRPDWKINYYQGLIYWANQNKAKALALFEAAPETGFAPFYLSRAALKEGAAREHDLLKAEQTGQSWRTGFALINYYVANNQWEKALEVGKKYTKRYPGNYYIGLKYAKALCETGQYTPCITLLRKLTVLPNEGSYAGRAVFRQANLYQSMDYLNHKNYARTFSAVKASQEWPENLGVGKPYDDMIDSRLENYIQAGAFAGQGNKEQTNALLQKVAQFESAGSHFVSGNLLSAIALRESGELAKANALVASWQTNYPDNRIAQWCTAVYRGEQEKAAGILKARHDQQDATPWEASAMDVDFDLIVRLFQ